MRNRNAFVFSILVHLGFIIFLAYERVNNLAFYIYFVVLLVYSVFIFPPWPSLLKTTPEISCLYLRKCSWHMKIWKGLKRESCSGLVGCCKGFKFASSFLFKSPNGISSLYCKEGVWLSKNKKEKKK